VLYYMLKHNNPYQEDFSREPEKLQGAWT
jgi:hypothetical protein